MVQAILALAFAFGAAASPPVTQAPVAVVNVPNEVRAPQVSYTTEPFQFQLLPIEGKNSAGIDQVGGEGFINFQGAHGEVIGVLRSSAGGNGAAGHLAGELPGDIAQGTAGAYINQGGAEGCIGGHLGPAGVTICAPNPAPTDASGHVDYNAAPGS